MVQSMEPVGGKPVKFVAPGSFTLPVEGGVKRWKTSPPFPSSSFSNPPCPVIPLPQLLEHHEKPNVSFF